MVDGAGGLKTLDLEHKIESGLIEVLNLKKFYKGFFFGSIAMLRG